MFAQTLMFEIFKKEVDFWVRSQMSHSWHKCLDETSLQDLGNFTETSYKEILKTITFFKSISFPHSFLSVITMIHGNIFFLLQAVGLLKDGGVLVYSTCTITPQENELQVAWALKSFPCLKLARQVSENLIQLFASL